MRFLAILALLATGALGTAHIITGNFTWLDVFAPLLFFVGLYLAAFLFRLLLATGAVVIAIAIVRHRGGLTLVEAAEKVRDRTLAGDPKHPLRNLFRDEP